MMAVKIVFWGMAALVAYVYAGYPLLARILAALFPLRFREDDSFMPSVTLVISAYNEEKVLPAKLANTRELDYPREKLHVLVVSDGSTDATVETAGSFGGVETVKTGSRVGKSEALNRAMPSFRGEVVVFSDANVMYERDCIKKLVRRFADPRVGCVCGELRYHDGKSSSSRGEGLYWNYESRLRHWEGLRGALISPNGTLFAMRRSLLRPLHPLAANDFQSAEDAAAQGAALVYAPEARAWEYASHALAEEFQRKVRIVAGCAHVAFTRLFDMPPARAARMFSHKILRWAAGFWLLGLYAASAALWREGGIYGAAFAAQTVFYLSVPLGWAPGLGSRFPFYVPLYLVAVQCASLMGLWRYMSGTHRPAWESPASTRRMPSTVP